VNDDKSKSYHADHYLDMVGETNEISAPYAGDEPEIIRAASSAVEHFGDIEGVVGSNPTPPTTGRTQLYRHFDKDGRLLYVGVSISALQRLAQHQTSSAWVPTIAKILVEAYPTREEALEAEVIAIRRERPMFNIKDAEDLGEKVAAEEIDLKRCRPRGRVVEFKPVYSFAEAARLLRCSERVLRGMIKDGRLDCIQLSKTDRVLSGWQIIDFLEFEHAKNA
jgi:GIY-YIG catalytic domain